MSLWINLKGAFARAADRITSPFPVMDLMGRDTYAASRLVREITAPEFAIPGLAIIFTGVAATIGVNPEAGLEIMQDGALGIMCFLGSSLAASALTHGRPPLDLYLDRRAPQSAPLKEDTRYWLNRWHQMNKEHMLIPTVTLPVALAIPVLTNSGKFLIPWVGAMAFKAAADVWRTHRAITGAWTTLDKLPPQQEEKAPAPAQAQGVSLFAPAP
ncbi:MAG: hypothetical protein J0L77_03925 [Alphaproteobacteria bacterium]|nr:hypothetical protein [Alphaproteobacteria bacterium]